MAIQNNSYILIPKAQYIPHFYKEGLLRKYYIPRRTNTLYPISALYTRYDFTSDLIRGHKPDQPQTVEHSTDMQNWTDIPVGETDEWTDLGVGETEKYYRVVEE